MKDSKREGALEKILIAGPNHVGKSTRLDILEEVSDSYERGGKFKFRKPDGVPFPEDGKGKDSKPVLGRAKLEELRSSGNVAFEYESSDTIHLVEASDAGRTDKHIVYITDTYNMLASFDIHFPDSIRFFLYTTPQIIERRLQQAKLPTDTIRERLGFYRQELALFLQNADNFHFPLFTREGENWPANVSDSDSKKLIRSEAEPDVLRMVNLVNSYRRYYQHGMSVANLHRAYIESQIARLIGVPLIGLEAKVDGGGIRERRDIKDMPRIDLSDQIKSYGKRVPQVLGDRPFVRVQGYTYQNGRHVTYVRGLDDPFNPSGVEDVVLDLIGVKLGTPTRRMTLKQERSFNPESNFGLVAVENALIRDGALYSLGDPIPTVPDHSALAIVFIYSNGKAVKTRGFTSEEVRAKFGWIPPYENGRRTQPV